MKKEVTARSEKTEVTETFCEPLKDEQKDPCARFYEEFAPEEAPTEANDPGKESGKDNPMANFCWPLSGKEKEECIQGYADALEKEGRRKE